MVCDVQDSVQDTLTLRYARRRLQMHANGGTPAETRTDTRLALATCLHTGPLMAYLKSYGLRFTLCSSRNNMSSLLTCTQGRVWLGVRCRGQTPEVVTPTRKRRRYPDQERDGIVSGCVQQQKQRPTVWLRVQQRWVHLLSTELSHMLLCMRPGASHPCDATWFGPHYHVWCDVCLHMTI